ncbi:MAG: hypothetical protein COZ70_09795 [Deltaproteobacteria bacterium CG_4_8_14_3_um_filter_51_11]|nr:hypothetical protein [bacterium]OIP39928.1 MAG: hypothetical protein AUK25_09240 [Desulfobacteraceae bacterium CG2_30_51_40]PIP47185.1 MAG: hypothetical protein COX16_05925 [Deltaproteobacteria bacterium CG23_combo_of_CG06-09_8_20_14_all_51_20]PIX19270.1 MAG: hypothetical protein COZ70_09795 [Deltaproteobacteria bacterium CG_4_8_14_3_um_filter_51_11]PIY27232.1 MAG: hypothetical protein COZ11_00705 [Deltaproteobacteria bacterium CG_4_10_14_3_um_filter_51_14]PJB34357.1 MAG: hypothetical prote
MLDLAGLPWPGQYAAIAVLCYLLIVFQGEDDRYLNCCSVEKIREINQAAKEKGRHFELTVYPGAGHGFNLGPLKNKELDAETWQKTIDALQRYLPLPAK